MCEFKVQCLQRLRVKGYLTLDVGDEVVLRDHDSCKGGVALGWCGSEQGKVMLSSLDLNVHLENEYLKACKPLSQNTAALACLFSSNHVLVEEFVHCFASAGCLFDVLLNLFNAEIREKIERGLETEQFREGSPSVALMSLLFCSRPAIEFASSFAQFVLIQSEKLSSMSSEDAISALCKELERRSAALPSQVVLVLAALLSVTSEHVVASLFFLRFISPAIVRSASENKKAVSLARLLQSSVNSAGYPGFGDVVRRLTKPAIQSQTSWTNTSLVLTGYLLYEWMIGSGFFKRAELDLGPIGLSTVKTEKDVPLANKIRLNEAILNRYRAKIKE